MAGTLVQQIKVCIEEKLAAGHSQFIIFPFGDTGMRVKHELNDAYNIRETFILDNHLCGYIERYDDFYLPVDEFIGKYQKG